MAFRRSRYASGDRATAFSCILRRARPGPYRGLLKGRWNYSYASAFDIQSSQFRSLEVPKPDSGPSQQLLSTLPFLRRYARALTGSQAHGDQWVRACLEKILQHPELSAVSSSKADIFALFHRVQPPFILRGEHERSRDATAPLDRLKVRLQDIPDRQRNVMLLIVLEGFTERETASILDMTEEDVGLALSEARQELKRTASIRVLVIEDEALIAMDVARIVRDAGYEVVGVAATEKGAVELAEKHKPDIVLADIQLKGGDNGIAAARQILKSTSVPIIFVTGFPERLLTGKGVEPAFVLTKPFDPEALRTSMAHALNVVSL